MSTALFLLAMLTAQTPPTAQPANDFLSVPQDWKGYLNGLFDDFLFKPPPGARRVRVERPRADVSGHGLAVPQNGWLVKGSQDQPARVCFTDGAWMPAPPDDQMQPVDFLAECRERLQPPATQPEELEEGYDNWYRWRRRSALGVYDESDLALSAWALHLGQEDLARHLLHRADKEAQSANSLKASLAWTAYVELRNGFSIREDDRALRAGERLFRLNPDAAKEGSQAAAIMADLQRRRARGTFGKQPADTWPNDFEKWPVERKIDYLIDSLDQVDARQRMQPGDVPLSGDRRVLALVKIGEPALPRLIEAVEKDARLTRSLRYWRNFAGDGTVMQVRDAALEAVEMILRERFYNSRSTSDCFSLWEDEARAAVVEDVRSYLKKYGHLDLQARQMAVLTDPASSPDRLRAAAGALVHPGRWSEKADAYGEAGFIDLNGLNPAVTRFKKPTAAEAILSVMDHDEWYQEAYLGYLVKLGDERIAVKIVHRARSAASLDWRIKLAEAAHALGDSTAVNLLAEEAAEAKIDLGRNDLEYTKPENQPAASNLARILRLLNDASNNPARKALAQLALEDHPWRHLVQVTLLANTGCPGREAGLRMLRKLLEDKAASSISRLEYHTDDTSTTTDARVCDLAAQRLSGQILGLPDIGYVKPADRDKVVDVIRDRFDRMGYRILTRQEWLAYNSEYDIANHGLILNILPLGRPATPEDVIAGRAVFHMDGKGKVAAMKLPAIGTIKPVEQGLFGPDDEMFLIVQAEAAPDGRVVLGVIGTNEVRTARPEEFDLIQSVDEAARREPPATQPE